MENISRLIELEQALLPFARVGAKLKGDEFKNLYELWGYDVRAITMSDLKRAQEVCGLKDIK